MIQVIYDILSVESLLIVVFGLAIICGLLAFFALSFQKRLMKSQIALAKAHGRAEVLSDLVDTVRNDLTEDEVDYLYKTIDEVKVMVPFSKRKFIALLKERLDFLEK